MNRIPKTLLIAAGLALSTTAGCGHRSYLTLNADRAVDARTELLRTSVDFTTDGKLFVHSDGSYVPITNQTAAMVFVEIDDQLASNEAVIDWRGTDNAQQHSFNVVGAKQVAAGSHTVALIAQPIAGAFIVVNGTNLAVMKNPARVVEELKLNADTGEYNFTTQGVTIPQGHNGVVFFAAKTRVFVDPKDSGGIMSLWIAIDGKTVGSTGIQQFRWPSYSQRTVSASYLAADSDALTPGSHLVQLFGRADGSFLHAAMARDLPLLWFD